MFVLLPTTILVLLFSIYYYYDGRYCYYYLVYTTDCHYIAIVVNVLYNKCVAHFILVPVMWLFVCVGRGTYPDTKNGK